MKGCVRKQMTDEEVIKIAEGLKEEFKSDFEPMVEFCQAVIDRFQKTGYWEIQRRDSDGCFYTCSNCGRMIRVPLFIDDPEDNETLADYPYCNCGTKMIGSKE